jgi:deoxyhypusine monooxygenase
LILWKKQNTEKAQLNEGHEIYMSVDPAPPSDEKPKYTVSELRERLLDKTLPIFQRYRALFKLRNIGDKEAVEVRFQR